MICLLGMVEGEEKDLAYVTILSGSELACKIRREVAEWCIDVYRVVTLLKHRVESHGREDQQLEERSNHSIDLEYLLVS